MCFWNVFTWYIYLRCAFNTKIGVIMTSYTHTHAHACIHTLNTYTTWLVHWTAVPRLALSRWPHTSDVRLPVEQGWSLHRRVQSLACFSLLAGMCGSTTLPCFQRAGLVRGRRWIYRLPITWKDTSVCSGMKSDFEWPSCKWWAYSPATTRRAPACRYYTCP